MKKDYKDLITPQVQVLTANWNKEKRYDENHSYFPSKKTFLRKKGAWHIMFVIVTMLKDCTLRLFNGPLNTQTFKFENNFSTVGKSFLNLVRL